MDMFFRVRKLGASTGSSLLCEEVVMHGMKWLRGLLAAVAIVAAGSPHADAALTMSVSNGSAVPGSPVAALPSFTLDMGTAYNLASINFTLGYDQDALTFSEAASKLAYNGTTYGLIPALDALVANSSGQFSYVAYDLPGAYTLSAGFTTLSLPLTGPLTLTAAFLVKPGVAIGSTYPVELTGYAGQLQSNQPVTYDDFSSLPGNPVVAAVAVSGSGVISQAPGNPVTTVPESSTWVMLVAGLALVLGIGRRRAVRV